MPEIRLHDTASGGLKALVPRDGHVGIYACGPTVYDRVHVGNGRPFVVFALLTRYLRSRGLAVTLVSNLTDINDKIYAAADRRGVGSSALAREMAEAYRADTDALGVGRPDLEPTATGSVGEIIALIETLIERGAAYASEGDVYFRVRADPAYGGLSHRAVEDMDQGEDDEAGEDAGALLRRKEDPLDFALWKAQKPGEDAAWDSPWGLGRPGWHIECSAMAEAALGLGFQVHGGGNDLAFPHHENEAAQTRCARGAELAEIWMHSGMLQMGGEKMAKSVGNVERLGDAVARVGRDALVLLYASGHYRQPLAYTDESVAQAQAGVRRLREAGRRLASGDSPEDLAGERTAFFDALADDFNTARALGHLWTWVREANRREGPVGDADLRAMLDVLHLADLLDEERADGPDDAALALLTRREEARAARDFAAADRLRDELREAGWAVRDGAQGATLVPVDAS